MKHFLIVVDMQKDFVDGALGTPEAQAIVGKVMDKILGFDGEIFATLDTHRENYGSLSNVGVEKNQNNFQRVSGISRHSFSDQSKRVFFCEISGSFLHRNRCV